MAGDNDVHGRDELITSSNNPTIKLARSLHRKRMRYRERAILVEGVRAILAALDLGVRCRAILIDASRVAGIDGTLLSRLRESAIRLLVVDPTLFNQVTDTEHPQPLVAICEMPGSTLPSDSTFVVALAGVRDPGNLGTLVRSAAAAGVDGVALLPGCVDPFNPKVVRASAGALFTLPVRFFSNLDEAVEACFVRRPTVVVADASGDRDYDRVDWTAPAAVVIGGEASGVDEALRTYADLVVRIPMAPGIESLNAAVAGSIIAFEVARQRRS